MGFSFAEISGHIAYTLILCSYLARTMILLRWVSIVASFAGIVYSFFVVDTPLWTPILWSVVFIAVNAWQISILALQRRERDLTAEEEFFHSRALRAVPRKELKSFLGLAHRRRMAAGEKVIRAGENLGRLFLIAEGTVRIELDGKEIAHLNAGSFLGEMSFLSKSAARADAIAAQDTVLLEWDTPAVDKWIQQDPARGGYLQTALGGQLIDQLMEKSRS